MAASEINRLVLHGQPQAPRRMMPLNYFVQTRRALALWSDGPPCPEWVARRRTHLHGITVPSLAFQSDRDFLWLVYVDASLAEEEFRLLEEVVEERFEFVVVPIHGRPTPEALEAPILERTSPGSLVATARLDSDDGFADGYVASTKAKLRTAKPPLAIDFPDGVMVDSSVGIPLHRPYAKSAFQTVLAEVSNEGRVITGLHFDHSRTDEFLPYHAFRTPTPQWFVSLHGDNTSSRAFGVPKPADVVPSHLRAGLGVRESSRVERAAYLAWCGARYGRSLFAEGDIRRRLRHAALAIPARGVGGHAQTRDLLP